MSSTPEMAINITRQIFLKGISSVIPSNLIRNQVELKGSILKIQRCTIDLEKYSKSFIIGFGKAVLPMAEELMRILDNKIAQCLLCVPEGTRNQTNPRIEMYKGAKNNIPDVAAFENAKKIVNLARACTEQDLLIVLISGGGSALLPYPKPPISLDEKINLVKRLSTAGASINELNSIRAKISVVKGGGLAKLCPAKRIVSLILSDVLHDRLDVIASGPTYPLNDAGNSLSIVQKYLKQTEVPPSILRVLQENNDHVDDVDVFKKVDNIIIGNNLLALRAAEEEAEAEGLIPICLTSTLEGEARNIGEKIAILSHSLSRLLACQTNESEAERVVLTTLEYLGSTIGSSILERVNQAKQSGKGICLLLGGETTVTVHGKGIGGRNQELALSAAMTLNGLSSADNITILSAGTDGIDGPCDAAGAVVNKSVFTSALAENINPENFLNDNNSYNFFKQLSGGIYHINTGHTGTNVMDLVVVLIHNASLN